MNSPLTTSAAPVLILEGCALAMLRTLPDACVDAIVTSPPYWGLRDYGIEPTDWPACSYSPMPGLPAIEVPAERSCLGLEPTLHAFLAHLVLIFEECRRVLKPTGSAWVNMGDGYNGAGLSGGTKVSEEKGQLSYRGAIGSGSIAAPNLKPKDLIGQPWRVAFALQAAGWYLRQDNIWHKPNPMPESIRDRATKAHEYVFHLTKSERYFFDLEAWSEKASEHTNPRMSKAAIERITEARANGANTSTGKLVVEPKTGAQDGHVKNNGSYKTAVCLPVLTRNKRSVWTVPTVAYSEAHYATYPPRLITPPILASTSAKGCCSQCGKPWVRPDKETGSGGDKEIPWQPTCDCSLSSSPSLQISPSIVLDPFGGSGTTAQVALEHGRHAILIERGPHNVALIHKRLAPVLAAPVLHLV